MSERPRSTTDELREAVAIRVQATSLRTVARQVGMSPGGLDKFLAGAVPRQKSRRQLYEWVKAETANRAGELSADGVPVALASLVRDLPPERRERALHSLLDTLRGLYDAHSENAPAWLAGLTRKADQMDDPAPSDRHEENRTE